MLALGQKVEMYNVRETEQKTVPQRYASSMQTCFITNNRSGFQAVKFFLIHWNTEHGSEENVGLVCKENQYTNKWKNGGSQSKKTYLKWFKKKASNVKHTVLQSYLKIQETKK